MRAWIAVALLAGSWMLGLGYYQPANLVCWTVALAAATLLLAGRRGPLAARQPSNLGSGATASGATASGATAGLSSSAGSTVRQANRGTRPLDSPGSGATGLGATAGLSSSAGNTVRQANRGTRPLGATATLASSIAMLVPAVWFMPWPYRAAPLAIVLGAVLLMAPIPRRWPEALGWGAIRSGAVLLAQSVLLLAYAGHTARSHDLPRPMASLAAAIASALGADAAAEGHSLAVHTMRRVHRIPVTWDLVFDPVTLCFVAGGLVILALAVGGLPRGERWRSWLKAASLLALLAALWLPIRFALVVACYLHRAVVTDLAVPLDAMNQVLSPWVLLLLLAVPVLLAWRFVALPQIEAADPPAEATLEPAATGRGPLVAAAASVLVAAAVVALVVTWDPVGSPKAGRVMVVERHSTWEPTTRPYSTTWYGELASYNYAVLYDYLSRFFEMSQLLEDRKIDDAALLECDVLVIKTPTERYQAEEIRAVERFVRRGGGLLLVGDHTNVFLTSSYLNDLARQFGFCYRHDLLFRIGSAYDQEVLPAAVPHPAVEHVPPMYYAVSCSIDPGGSWGRAAVRSSGLWGLPPDYHAENFHPQAEYAPEMQYGAFVQLWAARHGAGRVLAFTDSTIFSNFCVFQPGKAELMLNMIDWLNRSSPLDRATIRWPLTALLVLLAAALLVVPASAGLLPPKGGTASLPAFRWDAPWILLLSAGVLGATLGAAGAAAAHRRAMPEPKPLRPMTMVVIDRTVSQVPLSLGAFTQGDGEGYGLMEQWLPRLGCFLTRRSGYEAFMGDALVVICPSGSVSQEYRARLVEYVAAGGKLLVIDSPENEGTTANSLLWPFGMSVEHVAPPRGKLSLLTGWPDLELGGSCRIVGGEPFLWVGDTPVAARTTHGKGSVMAVGFGSLWNDRSMGDHWMQEPDPAMALRFDVLFAVVRGFLDDRPVTPPAPEESAAAGAATEDSPDGASEDQ